LKVRYLESNFLNRIDHYKDNKWFTEICDDKTLPSRLMQSYYEKIEQAQTLEHQQQQHQRLAHQQPSNKLLQRHLQLQIRRRLLVRKIFPSSTTLRSIRWIFNHCHRDWLYLS